MRVSLEVTLCAALLCVAGTGCDEGNGGRRSGSDAGTNLLPGTDAGPGYDAGETVLPGHDAGPTDQPSCNPVTYVSGRYDGTGRPGDVYEPRECIEGCSRVEGGCVTAHADPTSPDHDVDFCANWGDCRKVFDELDPNTYDAMVCPEGWGCAEIPVFMNDSQTHWACVPTELTPCTRAQLDQFDPPLY